MALSMSSADATPCSTIRIASSPNTTPRRLDANPGESWTTIGSLANRRAMVHARYGSKDAILEAFLHEYVKRLNPDPDPKTSGMQQVLAHFDRIEEIYTEDHELLLAMFVATFEAVKTTSPLRQRVRHQLTSGAAKVEKGLRKGIRDGSVRSGIDIARTVSDISTSVFGIAFWWTALPDQYDLGRELTNVRTRIVENYGGPALE